MLCVPYPSRSMRRSGDLTVIGPSLFHARVWPSLSFNDTARSRLSSCPTSLSIFSKTISLSRLARCSSSFWRKTKTTVCITKCVRSFPISIKMSWTRTPLSATESRNTPMRLAICGTSWLTTTKIRECSRRPGMCTRKPWNKS